MELINSLSFEQTPVSIYGTTENPLFCADEIGKLFGVKKITSSILDYNSNQKILLSAKTSGGIQDKIFLTEIGLYKFLFTSRKEIAVKFQEWVFNIIKELRINGKYELKEDQSSEPIIENLFFKMSKKQLRNKTLIDSNVKTKVVYICETDKKINGFPIIKIGKTDDVTDRLGSLIRDFGVNMNYIYMYRCEKNFEFEQFLFKIPFIKQNKYKEPFDNGKKSTETFLLSDDFTYEKIDKIIKQNIAPFEKITIEDKIEQKQIELDIKKIEFESISKSTQLKEIEKNMEEIKFMKQYPQIFEELKEMKEDYKEIKELLKKLTNKSDEIIIDEIKEKKSSDSIPYIQQYDEELNLIGYYDSFIQLTRIIPGTSTHGLKCAIQNNSIYHGYRWLLLDKSKNPKIPQSIVPTKETFNRKYELLAHINLSRDKIIKVYTEYSEIATEYKQSNSAIATARRRGTRCNGGYIVFYNECSEEMRNEYEENNILPTKPLSKTGTSVIQIDPITNLQIKTFNCISDVTKKFAIGRNKLKEASENKTVYKGFKWIIN